MRLPAIHSLAIFGAGLFTISQQVLAATASGTVRSSKNSTALQGVTVSVVGSSSISTTTDASGAFTLTLPTSAIEAKTAPQALTLALSSGAIQIRTPSSEAIELRLLTPSGNILWAGRATPSNGEATLSPHPVAAFHGIVLLQVTQGNTRTAVRLPLDGTRFSADAETQLFAARAAAYSVLSFKKSGYHDTTFSMTAASQSNIAVTLRDTTNSNATSCTLPTGPSSGAGSFTYYWLGQGSWSENGHYALACGYHAFEPNGQGSDSVANTATPHYFVAIPGNNSNDFNTRFMCGACVELTGKNGATIVATVTDECPENSNQPCLKNPSGHLDVSYPAFSKLNFGSDGYPTGTSWKYVQCPVTGNVVVRIKPGNPNQLYVENTVLPVKDVLVNGTSSTKLSYGPWQLSKNAAGTKVTIKDYSDRTITYTIPSSLSADTDQNTGLQFPSCK